MLAMAHWQLGEKAKAQACFDGASESLKGEEQDAEDKRKQHLTTVPLIVQLKRLQAEAAALLGGNCPLSSQHPSLRRKKRNLDVRRTPSPNLTRS